MSVSGETPLDSAARPARAGGAPDLSPPEGSGANLSSAGHVLNGEPSGSTRPTVVPPTSAGSTISAVCGQFVAARGAAWPWCDTCGWRLDKHDPDHPIARRWAEHWGVA
jgi:hypothetical protein